MTTQNWKEIAARAALSMTSFETLDSQTDTPDGDLFAETLPDRRPTPDKVAEREALADAAKRVLLGLSVRQLLALLWRSRGLSHKAIGRRLGVGEERARQIALEAQQRARSSLQRLLSKS